MHHRTRDIRIVHRLIAAALVIIVAGCASSAAQRAPEASARKHGPARASAQPPAPPRPPAIAPEYGPLHAAELGPYRFRIPAAYFRTQGGPYFDGGWSLHLDWPELGPVPMGGWRHMPALKHAQVVDIYYDYIDRVDINTLLERYTSPRGDSPEQQEDPARSFRLRTRHAPINGLTRFSVDYAVHKHYVDTYHGGNPNVLEPGNREDWYVAYRPDGRLRTLIVCDSLEVPEQYVIEDGRLRHLGGYPTPGCTHKFMLPDRKIKVAINYRRVFLHDWARFEQRAVELLDALLVEK